jgi:hypothetical protein
LCSLTGRYDNPIPTRFLAPIDCLKIPALESVSSQGKRNKAFAVIKSDMEEKERRRKKENSKVSRDKKT